MNTSTPKPPVLIKYQSGLEEALSFAALTITERYKFVDHLAAGETPKIVALCTRKPIEWVNSLDFDCYLDLAKNFIRENFPMAMRMATRDPIAALKVGPFLNQVGRVLQLLPSEPSAPTPASDSPSGSDSPTTAAPAAAAEATPAAVAP